MTPPIKKERTPVATPQRMPINIVMRIVPTESMNKGSFNRWTIVPIPRLIRIPSGTRAMAAVEGAKDWLSDETFVLMEEQCLMTLVLHKFLNEGNEPKKTRKICAVFSRFFAAAMYIGFVFQRWENLL